MLEKAQLYYFEHRHQFSPVIFALSFMFDLSMVRQPDTLGAMVFVTAHVLLSLTMLLVFARSAEADTGKNEHARRWAPLAKLWLEVIMQFSFGALASVLFVSYLKGADLVTSLPFLVLLALFLFGNEFAHNHRQRLWIRFSATLFLIYAYLLYFVPLIWNKLGWAPLAVSTAIAFTLALVMFRMLYSVAPNVFFRVQRRLVTATVVLLLGIPALIALGAIPPLPLAMREGTVVQAIARIDATSYQADVEAQPFYFRLGLPYFLPTYHVKQGGGLTFYTAIYAPADIRATIIHRWEHYDATKGKYVVVNATILPISGGRLNGYRTYSTMGHIADGEWRVTALLGTGQVLGHRTFNVVYGVPVVEEVDK